MFMFTCKTKNKIFVHALTVRFFFSKIFIQIIWFQQYSMLKNDDGEQSDAS